MVAVTAKRSPAQARLICADPRLLKRSLSFAFYLVLYTWSKIQGSTISNWIRALPLHAMTKELYCFFLISVYINTSGLLRWYHWLRFDKFQYPFDQHKQSCFWENWRLERYWLLSQVFRSGQDWGRGKALYAYTPYQCLESFGASPSRVKNFVLSLVLSLEFEGVLRSTREERLLVGVAE